MTMTKSGRSPDTPKESPVGSIDILALEPGDIVSLRYWSSYSRTENKIKSVVAEVVDVFPGSAHHPPSITIKTEAGEPRTVYKTGRVDSYYRDTPQGQMIGNDARIRRIRHGDSSEDEDQ